MGACQKGSGVALTPLVVGEVTYLAHDLNLI